MKAFESETGQAVEDILHAPPSPHMALLDGAEDEGLAAPPVHLALRSVEPIACRVPGMGSPKVYFDNFTHGSGHQRCFVQCTHHRNCRLYVFIKNYSCKEEAVAFLFGWLSLGGRFADPDEAKAHIAEKPTAEQVKAFVREQFPE